VHPTSGILRHFRAFSTPEQNPAFGVLSTPAHLRVTQTVETVEKPFASKNREKISHFGLKNAEFLLEKTKNRAIFDNFFPLCPVQFLRVDFFDSLVSA
jgi:hypothetical protein